MSLRTLSTAGLLVSTLLVAAHGSAQSSKTVDVRVGGVDITQGKVRAAMLSGANQGLLPGDKGFFTKDGKKVDGSDFEVYRVSDRVAWAMTRFPTTDELRFRTSLQTRITKTRTCASAGAKKPSFDDRETALGRKPPQGFGFATVIWAEKVTDTEISITIDKGTEDGVMPSSSSYALLPGVGAPLPYVVDIKWVTATTAGGSVTAGNAESLEKLVRRIGYERVVCKPSK